MDAAEILARIDVLRMEQLQVGEALISRLADHPDPAIQAKITQWRDLDGEIEHMLDSLPKEPADADWSPFGDPS